MTTTKNRLTLFAITLATLMAVSLEHSRAAGDVFQGRGPFQPSNSKLVPETLSFSGISRDSRRGEIASGSESRYVQGQPIVLNIRPCRGADGEFVSFRWPFRRSVVGSVNCGGSPVTIVQVQQQ